MKQVEIIVNGQQLQLDQVDRIAVSMYGNAGAAGDTALYVTGAGAVMGGLLRPGGTTTYVSGFDYHVDAQTLAAGFVPVNGQFVYNGATWDRVRNNSELTLLASAERAATTNSPDQINYNGRGFALFVDVTARDVGTTLEPFIAVPDPIGGTYLTIWTAAAVINAADTTVVYLFYPSPLADAAELYTEAVDIAIPRTFRVGITHSDANNITYSVAACVIR